MSVTPCTPLYNLHTLQEKWLYGDGSWQTVATDDKEHLEGAGVDVGGGARGAGRGVDKSERSISFVIN